MSVKCEKHDGLHDEVPECEWPHEIGPGGNCPVVFTEDGPIELTGFE